MSRIAKTLRDSYWNTFHVINDNPALNAGRLSGSGAQAALEHDHPRKVRDALLDTSTRAGDTLHEASGLVPTLFQMWSKTIRALEGRRTERAVKLHDAVAQLALGADRFNVPSATRPLPGEVYSMTAALPDRSGKLFWARVERTPEGAYRTVDPTTHEPIPRTRFSNDVAVSVMAGAVELLHMLNTTPSEQLAGPRPALRVIPFAPTPQPVLAAA